MSANQPLDRLNTMSPDWGKWVGIDGRSSYYPDVDGVHV